MNLAEMSAQWIDITSKIMLTLTVLFIFYLFVKYKLRRQN